MASFSGSNPTDSSNTVCVFTSSGSFIPQFSGTVEVLVVAGGGGGGMDMGGGGGGGGVISNSSVAVTAGVPVTVTVGAGGNGAPAGGTNGQPGGHQFTISATQGGNSVFGSLTAIGGGFGASSYYGYLPNSGIGGTGGSGGGCSGYTHGGERYVDNNNTPGQGFPGGNSGNPTTGADDHYSGGGGGAGARGTSGPGHTGPNGARADGGIGVLNTIMGVPYYWAGGGGGSCYTHTQGGNGGLGGGGGGAAGGNGNTIGVGNTSGINPSGNGGLGNYQPGGNGGTNTGGGGGGGSHYNSNNKGGDGGSGIVIVRFSASNGAVAVNANIINTDSAILSLDAANIKSVPVFSAEVLVVAGGGGGGSDMGGGGGGGGVVYNPAFAIRPGASFFCSIGNGGLGAPAGTGGHATTKGTDGGNSTVAGSGYVGITAIGGGAAGTSYYTFGNSWGNSGGSGGGGSGYNNGVTPALSTGTGYGASGAGTAGQGNRGGWGQSSYYSGGGGGAGGAGTDANSQPNGGPGIANSILGVTYFWAGGGGGAAYSLGTGGNGGIGGGGGGAVGVTTGGAGLNPGSPGGGGSPNSQTNTPGGNGGTNTGGGGGGGSHYNFTNKGGDGGSGIIVIRYPGPQRATGGTISTVGSDTVHTFTTSDTFTPNGVWTDLSNFENNVTLVNGVGYNSANGGSLIFDGSDDICTRTPTPVLLQGNPDLTVIGFYRRTGNFSSKGFWGIGGSNAGGVGQGICNWNGGNTNEITIDTWGQSTFTTGQTYPIHAWIGVAWRKIAGPMTRANCTISIFNQSMTNYTGGALTVLRAEAGTNPIINSIGGLTLGSISVDTGYCAPVDIASHHIYNRLLTDAEVLQYFNAVKERFLGYQTITYSSSANMTLLNNGTNSVTFTKNADNNSWNGQAYSTQAFSAPCTIEFSKRAAAGGGDNGASYAMIGWNTDPTTDASYGSIDHSAYPYTMNNYVTYNNGSGNGTGLTWDENQKFYVVYDTDGVIRHYNGSKLLYQASYGTNNTVYVDCSLYNTDSTFGIFRDVKVSRRSWNGTDYV